MYDGQVYSRGVAIPQYFSISVCGCGRIPIGINTLVFQYCSIATSVFQYFIKLSIAVFRHF